MAFIFAMLLAFPSLSCSRRSKATDVEIEIKIGNLFDQVCDIAIASSDCFDTDAPNVIPSKSLKAQLIKRAFKNDHHLLDSLLDSFLNEHKVGGKLDNAKTFGKKLRFPIGTVAVVPEGNRKIFIFVLTKILKDKTTPTSGEDLWISLNRLWAAVRQHGAQSPIAIPLFGAGLAAALTSRVSLVQLILISFAIATRQRKVTKKLIITIYDADYDPEEMMEFGKLLNTIEF